MFILTTISAIIIIHSCAFVILIIYSGVVNSNFETIKKWSEGKPEDHVEMTSVKLFFNPFPL